MAKSSTAVNEKALLDRSDKTTIEKNGKVFVERKELPSVQYLLAHGDPKTAHLPKTWCEIIGYPLALALIFAVSLLLFHHAPHHLLQPREKYSIPGIQRLPILQKNGKPPLHRHPSVKVTAATGIVHEEESEKSEF
jgi:hypothetical protein